MLSGSVCKFINSNIRGNQDLDHSFIPVDFFKYLKLNNFTLS